MERFTQIMEAVEAIKKQANLTPRLGLVLGSGLGEFAEWVESRTLIPYEEIPHFKKAGVAGHAGRLVLGKVASVPVAVMQGRYHYYEGHDIADVIFPIRVLARLGIKTLLLTNAAGGIGRDLSPGDLMIIRDHINLMGVYDPAFQEIIAEEQREIGLEPKRGVYAGLSGPSYETPAEIRMLAALGADAVGMSTVPEAVCARHMGVNVAGISCITNPAAGISTQPLSHAEVTETAERVKQDFIRLLNRVIPKLV
jgi:purine-nucleoside phosphorylase